MSTLLDCGKTVFKLDYLYVLIMAEANPGGGAEYQDVIRNFVGEKLRRNGIFVPGYDTEDIVNEPIYQIAATLRRIGDELERSNAEFFSNMCNQLRITPINVYPIFHGIADEIFHSGKNWGRIVAFLTFGSTFAVHCAARVDMGHQYVDRIVTWMSIYMNQNLDQWMIQHGSWGGFLDFFQNGNPDNGAHINGFFVSALAGIGIGALLMMTFK